MHRRMAEWTFKVMRLSNAEPFLDACITFTLLVVTLKLIGWHRDPPDMSGKSL